MLIILISLQWMHEMKACATIAPVSMREESWIVLHHYHSKQSIIIKAIRMRTKWNSFTWNCFIEHSKDNTHQFSHRDISFLSPHQRCHAWYYYGDMGASRPERVIKVLMFLQKTDLSASHVRNAKLVFHSYVDRSTKVLIRYWSNCQHFAMKKRTSTAPQKTSQEHYFYCQRPEAESS